VCCMRGVLVVRESCCERIVRVKWTAGLHIVCGEEASWCARAGGLMPAAACTAGKRA
jgi:hypothetical protein